jgi:5-methylcytosine-specific restriction endonuclease McrA
VTSAQEDFNLRRELERKRATERRLRTTFGQNARRDKITGKPCRACGRDGVEYHHIVPRAQMRRNPLLSHANNAMPLCHGCHQAHHTTAKGRIPRALLQPEEVEFVTSVMGTGWLDRWYPAEGAPA